MSEQRTHVGNIIILDIPTLFFAIKINFGVFMKQKIIGEWWHYSFGDREWAAFYGHSKTFYAPIYVSSGEE